MRTSFTLLASTLLSGGLVAQCTSAIPANATVVTTSTGGIVSGSGTTFWLCNSAFQQVFTGGNNNFYVEPLAFFNSINGSNNTIRYKGTSPMIVFGSNNIIYATSATAINDQGSGNTINVCGANGVVFTYGSAPANGCSTVGIEEVNLQDLQAHYDGRSEMIIVSDPNGQLRGMRVVDMNGRALASLSKYEAMAHSTATYPEGMYVVLLDTENGTKATRFVK